MLCVIIGSTTFDGLSNGQVWSWLEPKLTSVFSGLDVATNGAVELSGTVGLAFSILLAAGL